MRIAHKALPMMRSAHKALPMMRGARKFARTALRRRPRPRFPRWLCESPRRHSQTRGPESRESPESPESRESRDSPESPESRDLSATAQARRLAMPSARPPSAIPSAAPASPPAPPPLLRASPPPRANQERPRVPLHASAHHGALASPQERPRVALRSAPLRTPRRSPAAARRDWSREWPPFPVILPEISPPQPAPSNLAQSPSRAPPAPSAS